MSFKSGGGDELNAEINVTPMVDVMLVLLIIFMITTQLAQPKIKVELPQATLIKPPDDQPAVAQVVDQRELFGQPDRVVQRGLRHREADADPPGRHRQGGGEGDRIDVGAVAVEMVLGEPDCVEAERVGEARLRQRLLDHHPIARRIAALGEQEVAEFHADGAGPI